MDFSKLGQNEKLAVYGAIAVIIGGLVGLGAAGFGFLAVAAAVGVLVVAFLPQFSPQTSLPGSKGSLLLLLGAVAGVILVLGLLNVLSALGILLQHAFVATLFYLVAVAGGVLMAWAGWQEFQAEGGKFQVGTATGSSATATATRPSDGTVRSAPASTSEAEARTTADADAPAAGQTEARTPTDAAEQPADDRSGQP